MSRRRRSIHLLGLCACGVPGAAVLLGWMLLKPRLEVVYPDEARIQVTRVVAGTTLRFFEGEAWQAPIHLVFRDRLPPAISGSVQAFPSSSPEGSLGISTLSDESVPGAGASVRLCLVRADRSEVDAQYLGGTRAVTGRTARTRGYWSLPRQESSTLKLRLYRISHRPRMAYIKEFVLPNPWQVD